MTNLILTDYEGTNWMRIDKRRARTLYYAGHDIVIAPVHMDPFGAWHTGVKINRADAWYNETFATIVHDYEYYNCSAECGKYAAFYVRSGVIS